MVQAGALLGLVEAALEAWAECRPVGMTLAEESVLKMLPIIAARVPGALGSPDAAHRLHGVFNSKQHCADHTPLFVQMLRPHAGQVHFLYFWRAFGEASRLVSGGGATGSNAQAACLTAELELLR